MGVRSKYPRRNLTLPRHRQYICNLRHRWWWHGLCLERPWFTRKYQCKDFLHFQGQTSSGVDKFHGMGDTPNSNRFILVSMRIYQEVPLWDAIIASHFPTETASNNRQPMRHSWTRYRSQPSTPCALSIRSRWSNVHCGMYIFIFPSLRIFWQYKSMLLLKGTLFSPTGRLDIYQEQFYSQYFTPARLGIQNKWHRTANRKDAGIQGNTLLASWSLSNAVQNIMQFHLQENMYAGFGGCMKSSSDWMPVTTNQTYTQQNSGRITPRQFPSKKILKSPKETGISKSRFTVLGILLKRVSATSNTSQRKSN